MKTYLLVIFLFIITPIDGHSQDKPEDFDFGKVENNTYLNSYFNFELKIPTDWVVQTQEQMNNLQNKGRELVAGDDTNLKTILKASEINTANLLAAFEFERGTPVDYNPSIIIVAENITHSPGIKTGSDYLFHARKIIEQSAVKYDHLDKEFKKKTINNTDFYIISAEINVMGTKIKQIYYSTVLKGFSFNVIISFVTKGQKKDLLNSINTIKFNK